MGGPYVRCPCKPWLAASQAGQWQAGPASRASQELPADVGLQHQGSLPFGVRPLFAAPQSAGPNTARAGSGAVDVLRQTASGVVMPDGLTLEDLLRLGEEIVPAPEGGGSGAAQASGPKLDGVDPMQLVAFLASKVTCCLLHLCCLTLHWVFQAAWHWLDVRGIDGTFSEEAKCSLSWVSCSQAPSKAEGKALLANPALLEQELASAEKATSSKRPAPPPPPPPPLPPQSSACKTAAPKTVSGSLSTICRPISSSSKSACLRTRDIVSTMDRPHAHA